MKKSKKPPKTCFECGNTNLFWHCKEGVGAATCRKCRVMNWFREDGSNSDGPHEDTCQCQQCYFKWEEFKEKDDS